MDSKIKTASLKEQRPLISFAERVKTIMIRPIVFGLLSLFLIPLSSCKKDQWMDWKLQNDMWLMQNKTKEGVKTTNSGLQYKIIADPLAESNDARPNPTSTVICDYTLKLINGTVIETTYLKPDSTVSKALYLGSTIPGFTEGCHKVHLHGDIELYIPAELGYDYQASGDDRGTGTEGYKKHIPPYSTLIYSIHICGIQSN